MGGMRRLFFTLFLFLTACGDSPPSETLAIPSTDDLNRRQLERYERAHRPVFVSWDKIDSSLHQFNFETCEDCPVSFGHFITQTEEVDDSLPKPARVIRTGNCQGAMVSENLFLTSRHCLPKDLQEKEKNCTGRIKILLSSLGNLESKTLECEKIVDFAPGFEDFAIENPQPDWALVETKESIATRFNPVDSSGLTEGDLLYGWIPLISPDSEKIDLIKIECQAIQRSLKLPEFLNDQSPIALLKCDRDITKGFSGTALFRKSEEGYKAVAVLSHLWDTQVNKEDIIVAKYIVASNNSCIPDGENDVPETCDFKPSKTAALKRQLVLEALETQRQKILDELKGFLEDESQPVQWALTDPDNISQMPKGYPEYLQSLKSVHYPHLPKKNRKFLFQSMIPIFAQCIKKEVIAENAELKLRQGISPSIRLDLVKNGRRQLVARHWLRNVPIEIRLNRQDNNTYVLSRMGPPLPPMNRPQNRIVSERFSHLSVQIPPCP